mgnify:FL=1
MPRKERFTRNWLLEQAIYAPNDSVQLTGYLKILSESNWYTFTQIENEEGKRIAGHLNLPKKKVDTLISNIQELNNQPFILIGKPSFYVTKSVKRGSINIDQVIHRPKSSI